METEPNTKDINDIASTENVGKEDIATVELGQLGLKRASGYMDEDYLPELRGKRGAETYSKMKNDPILGAGTNAIDLLTRQVEWDVVAFSDEEEDVENGEFLKTCFDDMEQPWRDTISEIMSMVSYGWSYHEIVYKMRKGPESEDARFKSQYDDNKIGWRKFAIRGQDTLLRWEYESPFNDNLLGMTQMPPPSYRSVFIPLDKAMLFRPSAHKNSPEGRSVYRSCYEPWYYKRNLQKIEAIGAERDLAGLPVLYAPPAYFSKDATPANKQSLENAKKIVRNLRRDEQEGVVLPYVTDSNGTQILKLELLSSGGSRQFDTDKVINRYDQRMAMVMLADFILLGHDQTGSYSLADSKTTLFTLALGAWLDIITDIINRQAIPRLWKMNDLPMDRMPKLKYGDIENIDLKDIAALITSLSGAGMPLFPDDDLEAHIRRLANLPEKNEIMDLESDRDPSEPDDMGDENGET